MAWRVVTWRGAARQEVRKREELVRKATIAQYGDLGIPQPDEGTPAYEALEANKDRHVSYFKKKMYVQRKGSWHCSGWLVTPCHAVP